ncbi:MAG: phosphatidate cytidylyltransferase [bacterium]|nr:phosphatidate cytidylyltransferase [bacterium]
MKTRVIGAIIILSIFIPFIIQGGLYFTSLSLILGLVGFKELYDVRYKEKKLPLLLEILSFLAVGFLIVNNCKSNELTLVLDYQILSLFMIVFLLPIVIIGDIKKYNLEDALYLLGSAIFIGLSFHLMIIIRNYSLLYLTYFFVITTMTDVFALFTGQLIGTHKLCPKISPKKTIEGLIGGTIMGVFTAIIFYLTVINANMNLTHLLIVTLTLSLIGQLGDLVFSAIKRLYGKKDFSNLIPGHGGVLDRFDSVIFVIITAVLFIGII